MIQATFASETGLCAAFARGTSTNTGDGWPRWGRSVSGAGNRRPGTRNQAELHHSYHDISNQAAGNPSRPTDRRGILEPVQRFL